MFDVNLNGLKVYSKSRNRSIMVVGIPFAISSCNRTHKLLTNFSKNWFNLLPGPFRIRKMYRTIGHKERVMIF